VIFTRLQHQDFWDRADKYKLVYIFGNRI